MIRENKFRHIRIRKVVILIDTNSIFPQLFVFPSKGGFRQSITQNVRILDNLNFSRPGKGRDGGEKNRGAKKTGKTRKDG